MSTTGGRDERGAVVLSNKIVAVEMDAELAIVQTWHDLRANLSTPLVQQVGAVRQYMPFWCDRLTSRRYSTLCAKTQFLKLLEYRSFTDQEAGKCSGWYIFRSENDGPALPLDGTAQPTWALVEGTHVPPAALHMGSGA